MSRSQGAANNGWPVQRHPAGEPDPRSGGHPAQRPQAPQYARPQQAPGYPQQAGYGDQRGYAEAPPYSQQPPSQPQQQPGYHYPQAPAPQYSPPQPPQYGAPQAPQNAAPPPARQSLSSLESARNAQPTHDFENFPRTQPPQYARQPHTQPPQRSAYAAPGADDPITAAGGYRQARPQAPQYAAPQQQRAPAPGYEGWPTSQPAQDAYGQSLGGYADTSYPANGNPAQFDPLQQADWALPAAGYGDPAIEQQAYGHGQLAYDQGHGGALEPTYNQDEAYEAEEPRRVSWTMRIAGAVVVAIGLGYGLAQAYKAVLGSPPESTPPVIASDSSPAKERPADPGGKQFSHTDSKVLGRLGEGGSEASPSDSSSSALSQTDTDSNGARQVKTLVVGRDGSIAPPAEGEPEGAVSVPGLTVVDAFGSAAQPPPQHVSAPARPEPEPAASEPPRSGVNVKTTKVIPASTASIPEDDAAAAAKPKRQKVAAAAPDETPSTSSAGANGYVVVLASVPASATSRLDALRKFADMQQQYGPVLASKTPDVRETTLAGKGLYHRLLVGPPGSRSQASELCTQLKAYGYKDCWVTAY